VAHPAAQLLTELHSSGVGLGLEEDGELWVTPSTALNASLKQELQRHGQLLEQLLLLQAFQSELDNDHNAFMDGGGSEEFGRLFDEWYSRDQLLRNVLGYTGCIYGDGRECPDTVVRCERCSPTQNKRRFKKL
jgi:hypothetical protein